MRIIRICPRGGKFTGHTTPMCTFSKLDLSTTTVAVTGTCVIAGVEK